MIIDKVRSFATKEELQAEFDITKSTLLECEEYQKRQQFQKMQECLTKGNQKTAALWLEVEQRYILSFCQALGFTANFLENNPAHRINFTAEEKEAMRTAIWADATQVFQEIEKADFQFNTNVHNYETCCKYLLEIIKSQISAYVYYKLPVSELIDMAGKKAAEWYKKPKEFDLGKIPQEQLLPSSCKYFNYLQNKESNALGHTSKKSFNNAVFRENNIKTHEDVEIKILSPDNFFSSKWNVPTHKVYDLLLHKLSEILPRGTYATAEKIKNNRTVEISVKEFADKCHTGMKEARQYLNEAISTLYELSIKFEVVEPEDNTTTKSKRRKKNTDLQPKKYAYHRILAERSDDDCNNAVVNGVATVKFDFDFAEFMSRCSRAMPKHDNMFRINGNRHPHSYFMANKLQEHYFMNIGKNNSNRIKVRSLIQDLPDLPTYDEVMQDASDGHIEQRIIKPFEKNLQALVDDYDIIENWHYCTKNGEFLTDEQLQNYDYSEWIEWLVEFRLKDYPHQVEMMRLTEQIERNKNSKKAKKEKNKSEKE